MSPTEATLVFAIIILAVALLVYHFVAVSLIRQQIQRIKSQSPPSPRAASVIPPAQPAVCPPWTDENTIEWKRFLGSPTGHVFMARLYSWQAAMAIQSMKAAGLGQTFIPDISDAIRWIEQLASIQTISRVPGDQGTNTEPAFEGESQEFEHLAP